MTKECLDKNIDGCWFVVIAPRTSLQVRTQNKWSGEYVHTQSSVYNIYNNLQWREYM